MTTRVVLFLLMGTLLGFVAGISSYQHIFSASKGIVYSEKKNEGSSQALQGDWLSDCSAYLRALLHHACCCNNHSESERCRNRPCTSSQRDSVLFILDEKEK